MLVASAISLCLYIRGLRSISVQRKLPWQRTSDDEHSALRNMGVLPGAPNVGEEISGQVAECTRPKS
jgi:hypothetical protein